MLRLVFGMVVGADGIDGMGWSRHGAIDRAFAGMRAPPTLGSFLRAFTHGHVQHLAAVCRKILPALASHAPLLPRPDAIDYVVKTARMAGAFRWWCGRTRRSTPDFWRSIRWAGSHFALPSNAAARMHIRHTMQYLIGIDSSHPRISMLAPLSPAPTSQYRRERLRGGAFTARSIRGVATMAIDEQAAERVKILYPHGQSAARHLPRAHLLRPRRDRR